jgi:MSHA pilin protein MshD
MSIKLSTKRLPRQRGVTLIELILFIIIVGVALGGIITVMNLTTRASADPARRKQALIIAEGLLEEVELAKFSFCDPADPNAGDASTIPNSAACAVAERWGQESPGATNGRPFDNVNDYVAAGRTWTASFDDANGVLTDANGNRLDVTGYTVKLMITPESLGPDGATDGSVIGDATDNSDVLRISVQVSYDGQTLMLEGYRTRYAPHNV